MKTIELKIELTYNDKIMHGSCPTDIEWFYDSVLGGELRLHSNFIGDDVGSVKVIRRSSLITRRQIIREVIEKGEEIEAKVEEYERTRKLGGTDSHA